MIVSFVIALVAAFRSLSEKINQGVISYMNGSTEHEMSMFDVLI